ncbi:MAG TPA: surface-adhesin E family protein, partial [Allosphingosinicella sp.]
MIRMIAFFILAAVGSPAFGEKWVPSVKIGSVTSYVDKESIAREGSAVRFTQRYDYDPRTKMGEIYIDRMITLIRADCDSRSFELLRRSAYLAGELNFGPVDLKVERRHAVPGSRIDREIGV